MFLTGPTGEHTSQDAKEIIPIGQADLDKPTKIHKKGKGIEIYSLNWDIFLFFEVDAIERF